MDGHQALVKIVGEPFRSRAAAYFRAYDAAFEAWAAFATRVGATSLTSPFGGVGFDGRVPKGWVAVGRNGGARPRKGSPEAAEMAALPRQPSGHDVFAKAVIYDLSYEGPDVRGSGAVGTMFFGPRLARAGEIWLAAIPHAGPAAAAHLARHPDHRILNGADGWTVPEGLVEISQAEMDFIVAEHNLRREREKAVA